MEKKEVMLVHLSHVDRQIEEELFDMAYEM